MLQVGNLPPVAPEEGEKIRTQMTVVVPLEGIVDTGTISFKFMFDANMPYDRYVFSRPYGMLRRVPKDANYVNPFKLVRGESGAIGDDGVARWQIFLGQHGQQELFASIDDDEAGEGLSKLLQDVPDCIVLVPPQDIEDLLKSQAVDLQVITYDGKLATS